MSFKLFESDQHTRLYSMYRPSYPESLYDKIFPFIKSSAASDNNNEEEGHGLTILDVACGSGQASFDLVKRNCRLLIGIDPSQNQIENAIEKSKTHSHSSKIIFEKANAEDLEQVVTKYSKELQYSEENEGVFDLITVAQGLHWFDFEPFFKLVQKYLKKGGVFAAWCYVADRFESEKAQQVRDSFYDGPELTPLWSHRRYLIDKEYRTIPNVPFSENISFHEIWLHSAMSLESYIHYISTWSAVNAFGEKYGNEAMEQLLNKYQQEMLKALELENEKEEFPYKIPFHLLLTFKPLQ